MKAKNILGKAAANLALTNAKHAANSTYFAFFGQKKCLKMLKSSGNFKTLLFNKMSKKILI